MSCRHLSFRAAPLLLGLCLLHLPGHGQTLHAGVLAQNQQGSVGHAEDGSLAPVQDGLDNTFASGATYHGIAIADYGQLRVRAAVSVPVDAADYSSGNATATFADSLAVASATLAAGTPVTLQFTLAIDGASQLSPDPALFLPPNPFVPFCGCGPYAFSTLQASEIIPGDIIVSQRAVTFQWNALMHSAQVQTFTLDVKVGETVGLDMALVGQALVYSSGITAAGVDFLPGAYAYAAALTPGVQLTSLSGHDYAMSAVPAPPAALAFGAGLCVMFNLARRRRGWAA